jgi:DNA-binding transcriptional regulator LsrR (DeoR family)
MLERGMSQREVGVAFGVPQQTVSRLAAEQRQVVEIRENWSWDDAVNDPEGFISSYETSTAALRAIKALEARQHEKHREDHPHSPNTGAPLEGFQGVCGQQWEEHLKQRNVLMCAWEIRWGR